LDLFLSTDGLVDELINFSVCDDLAVIDDYDAVGALFGFFEVVGSKKYTGAFGTELVEHIEDTLAALWIDADGRFIEE
jgi:hypothetical protein